MPRWIALLVLLSSAIVAQEAADPVKPISETRQLPEYGGEIDEGSQVIRTTGRIIFFPAFLVTEYGLRWPLTAVARPIEKNKVVEKTLDYLTWYEERIGIRPTVKIETDRAPGVGAMLFWKELTGRHDEFKIGANTDFKRNINADASNTFEGASGRRSLTIGGSVENRDDFNYYGEGANTFEEDEAEFFRSKRMGYIKGSLNKDNDHDFGGWLQLEAARQEFECGRDDDDDICGLDHIAGTADDRFALDNIDSFQSGFDISRLKGNVFFDSRRDRPYPGSGVRVELFGRFGQGINSESKDIQFFRYGGETGFFLDLLSHAHRVIGLRFNVEFAEATRGNRIPFSELITRGGTATMRGFAHARFHGQSAVLATLDYRYPVWSFVDGYLFADVGNTFGLRLEDFATKKLRGSTGLGFRSNASRQVRLNVQFGFGTTRFDASQFGFESHRFVFGSTWGF